MLSNMTLVCELKEYVQSVRTAMLESTTTCSKERSRSRSTITITLYKVVGCL
jgi:hypothetical protein